MMRRMITLLLVFSLLLIPIPVSAADSGSCGENAKYTRSGSTLKITGKGELNDFGLQSGYMGPWIGYRGDIKKIVIGEGITGIGKANFANFKALTSVTLPKTLTKISKEAFYGCTALTEVVVPDAVASIGDHAFYKTGLTDLTLGSGLTEIGEYAFTGTKLRDVTIPAGVSTVSRNLFSSCNELTKVVFEGHIRNIGEQAFHSCDLLADVQFEMGLSGRINSNAFSYCAELEAFDFPVGVTEINDSAFAFCENLASVTFPEGLEYLGGSAFRETALTEVYIPESVTRIGYDPFVFCDELEHITLHTAAAEGIRQFMSVGDSFSWAHIIGNAPETTKEIFGSQDDDFILYYDAGTSGWELPTWNGYVIEVWGQEDQSKSGSCGENLTWTLRDGVLTISGTGLMDDYSSGERFAAPWYVYAHRITGIVIEEGVTSLGEYAFRDLRSVQSVQIAESVETLDRCCFENCSALTEVEIPAGVSMVGSDAFRHCLGLETVHMRGEHTKIGSSAFSECNSLTDVTLPSALTELSDGIFAQCFNLSDINIPDTVTHIGDSAFSSCFNLKAIDLPENLISIGSSFYSSGLTEITLPAGIQEIDALAFSRCNDLERVNFMGDAPNIHGLAFMETTTVCTYPGGNPTWTEDKFQNYGGNLTWLSTNPHIHTLEKVAAREATHEEEGNIEYYICPCGVWYRDETGTEVIEDHTCVVIPRLSLTYGDVNHDGKINVTDAVMVMKHRANALTEEDVFCEHCANVDTNPKINVSDAVLIMKKRANKDMIFPIEEQ